MSDLRFDRQSEPFALSTSGVARREAMLAELQGGMSRLHRARNARRRAACLAVPAVLLAGLIWLRWPLQRPPNAPVAARSNPSERPEVAPVEPVGSEGFPAIRIVRVFTDSSATDRFRANVGSRASRISDEDLLDTLAAIDRPAGLVRSGDRVWLTRAVADEPSAQGG